MNIGVCSWSLQPASAAELTASITDCGLNCVQLALEPFVSSDWSVSDITKRFDDANITILSAMVQTKDEDYTSLESIRKTGGLRPDAHWKSNLELAKRAADLAANLGVNLITYHAGFLPEDTGDPEHAVMIDRIAQFSGCFTTNGIRVGLETGQETAATLNLLLDELKSPNLGINFDPANMILYGMGDPIASLDLLTERVMQVHLKDANLSSLPQTWGEEVIVGSGEVDWPAFFRVLDEHKLDVDCVLEREAGTSRVADIRQGCEVVRPLCSWENQQ